MKALILSGGNGTRLRPLTYSTPKQLIPVANKPVLFYIIEKVVQAGITDIGIVVGDTHEQIKSSVGSGERWKANITYIYQPSALGLAHAVKTASHFINNSDFLMVLGDNLFQMELRELIDNFYQSGSNASILLHRTANPSQFGVAVIENGRIVKLVEKPEKYVSDLIITGVYIFDKNIFDAIDNISPSERGELEITHAIQRLVDEGKNVSYRLTRGWWKDTGKLSSILDANQLVLDEIQTKYRVFSDSSSIYIGKVKTGDNVTIKNSIINGPVVIGDNSIIMDSKLGPYSSIGAKVKIESCEIENSIVLQDTIIENIQGKITKSLIGKNAILKGSYTAPPVTSSTTIEFTSI